MCAAGSFQMFKQLKDLPKHKIVYLIERKEMVEALWETLKHYGIEFNPVNHENLIRIVQEILEGPDIEREWSKVEYENFVQFKKE